MRKRASKPRKKKFFFSGGGHSNRAERAGLMVRALMELNTEHRWTIVVALTPIRNCEHRRDPNRGGNLRLSDVKVENDRRFLGKLFFWDY